MAEAVCTNSPIIGTPAKWLLIFNEVATNWRMNLIAMGHYKHVSAIGHVPEMSGWVLYDPQIGQTRIAIAAGDLGFRSFLDSVAPGGHVGLMWFRPLGPRRRFPPTFFCTTAISHLIGLPGCALRPDALWRTCLQYGGEIVITPQAGRSSPGPDVLATTAASAN